MSHLTLDTLCLLRRECDALPMLKRCTIALKERMPFGILKASTP